MTDSIWSLFPYPTLSSEGLQSGAIVPSPEGCISCESRPCQSSSHSAGEIHECRFGYHTVRLDEQRLVVGLIATDLVDVTSRARRRARRERSSVVKSGDLLKAAAVAHSLGPGVVEDFGRSKEEMMARLRDDPQMFAALADQLRQDFAETLTQSHDFLQLVKLVRGYAETLLLEKHPESKVEDAAEREPVQGAIYFATELMLMKVDSLVYLNEINQAFGDEVRFQIHPYVLKYVRIYRWQASQKELAITLEGSAFGRCFYNSNAIGAVIQGLLDNMVKYAPARTKASIEFEEDRQSISIIFRSLGPRIEEDERSKIFLPGYRGVAAKADASDGLGVGLATAKNISDALGLELQVDQAETSDLEHPHHYETSFRLRLQT